jgi:AcrR family transcriptional regulator
MTGTDQAGRRRSRTPSADVPRELLGAAEHVLVKDGMAGLTVRAVAAAAGVAPMSVYNQFGGKGGLLAALLLQGFDRLRAAIDVDDAPDTRTRLRRCCLRYREFALANPHLYVILFTEAVPHAGNRGEVEQHAAACLGVLTRNVELAAAAGTLAAADTRETAQQIWSALHGAVTLELRGFLRTPDPAAIYQALLDTIVRGLGQGHSRDGTRRPGDDEFGQVRRSDPVANLSAGTRKRDGRHGEKRT